MVSESGAFLILESQRCVGNPESKKLAHIANDFSAYGVGPFSNVGRVLCVFKAYFEAFVILFLLPSYREIIQSSVQKWWRRLRRNNATIRVAAPGQLSRT